MRNSILKLGITSSKSKYWRFFCKYDEYLMVYSLVFRAYSNGTKMFWTFFVGVTMADKIGLKN